jgi:hypothetical protein
MIRAAAGVERSINVVVYYREGGVKVCKWQYDSISPSCPEIIYKRCVEPKMKGVNNCIGEENCADYAEIERDDGMKGGEQI